MKKLTLIGAACLLMMVSSQHASAQANTKLSNLVSPTAINVNLLPGTNCTRDLGSTTKKWRNLYLCNRAGINVNPAYPLDIYNTANIRSINTVSPNTGEFVDRIGLYTESVIRNNYGYGVQAYGGFYGVYASGTLGSASNTTNGVYGIASGDSCVGTVIGVQGYAYGAANNYGVYGSASNSNCSNAFSAAGYFSGPVYATAYNTLSDRKFKNNITPVKNPLEQLMKLKPAAYEFKTNEYADMSLPKGKQLGLIADEVKAVFPDFVSEAVRPALYDKDRKLITKEVKYESVNYIQLIPLLIASVQEQQKTIDAVTAENQELKSRLGAIEQALNISNKTTTAAVTLTEARLDVNAPNPFNQRTVIGYYLPQKFTNAALHITDISGKLIKTVALNQTGKGQYTLEAGQLAAGTYQYALVVNGNIADAKKMVLTK